ncbi:Glutathione-regulated potassium-efflux system protein KefC [Gemmata sp. SH-PL17]|uniref:potassium channel family protein n=1 Tax=Gemmata sp. SH-PL17 TaxID=1630693 RepID=UPI00078E5315|nr:NAD-binding protein [Gemmata sp. SH-PL17]AMV27929.1 Glutathione-regulated potassium-efflux system protein KefC [Gemmata sp. SH-PL17]
MERPVLLCGLGRVGWRVLDSLRAAGLPVVVIDIKADPNDPRLAGVTAFKGDCRRHELLEQAGIKDARGIVIVTSDDLVNISTALLARKLNPTTRVVVRMFNQNLIARFGGAVKNTVALSVSALVAPVLALTAVTGDALGAFKLDDGPRQISELVATEDSELIGQRIADLAAAHGFTPLAFVPVQGDPQFLLNVNGSATLAPGDRLIVCGPPAALQKLLQRLRGDLLAGVKWAGTVRRWVRTARRTLLEVDLSVKIITPVLFVTLLISTLTFRYGIGTAWGDGLYQTVSIIATGGELHGENKPEWAKVFISILKLAGAALVAGFTAILTNYLIRARLGGALEMRRVPDGGHVVVCGLGNVGYRLVQELTAMGERVVAIDKENDGPFFETVRRMGVPVFVGDATVPEILRQARSDSAKAVIAATSSELGNIEIALLVREMGPKQRVVVRLSEPEFAEAVREAAEIRHAMAVPALAAPAFASALYGDSVQTLVSAAGRTLVIIDLVVNDADDHLNGKSLRAIVLDYALLPVALSGRDLNDVRGYRLKVGDKLTVVAELPDYERLLRLQRPAAVSRVVVDTFPATAMGVLATHVRLQRGCTVEEASAIMSQLPFVLNEGLTRGEAQELTEQLEREKVVTRIE